ncbi:MAG: PD-(D/E)XK nuclease superfamily protein [Chloroflexota bacterium]
MMAGKRKATIAGKNLEQEVAAIGEILDLEVRPQYQVGRRLWGAKRHIDFVLTQRQTRKSIGIECKAQNSRGSLEEKISSTIKDIEAWPINGLVVISGIGFSDNIRSYLYSTGRVVDVEDLEEWLRLYFSLEPKPRPPSKPKIGLRRRRRKQPKLPLDGS